MTTRINIDVSRQWGLFFVKNLGNNGNNFREDVRRGRDALWRMKGEDAGVSWDRIVLELGITTSGLQTPIQQAQDLWNWNDALNTMMQNNANFKFLSRIDVPT